MSEEKEEKKGRKRTRDVLVDEDIEFKGLLLSEAVQKGLSLAGFEKPSPIQLQAIPLGKFGVDLIAQAKSGTGKTLVFSIIALETINTSLTSPQALILAPTREIAVQIVEVIKKVGAYIEPPLLCESFIGGTPVSQDINNLKRGCQILVGTPGRVKDLIENSNLNTETLRILIFDEADKLLEESFLKQIEFGFLFFDLLNYNLLILFNSWIVKKLPQRKQILALSATYTPQMLDIMKSYMNQPQFILLSPDTPSLEGVKQYYLKVSSKNDNRQKGKSLNANWDSFEQKSKSLIELLSKLSFNQCLIFCNNRDKAQNICEALNNEGWPSRFISGDIDQSDRLEIMEALKNFEIRVLVSTDLVFIFYISTN